MSSRFEELTMPSYRANCSWLELSVQAKGIAEAFSQATHLVERLRAALSFPLDRGLHHVQAGMQEAIGSIAPSPVFLIRGLAAKEELTGWTTGQQRSRFDARFLRPPSASRWADAKRFLRQVDPVTHATDIYDEVIMNSLLSYQHGLDTAVREEAVLSFWRSCELAVMNRADSRRRGVAQRLRHASPFGNDPVLSASIEHLRNLRNAYVHSTVTPEAALRTTNYAKLYADEAIRIAVEAAARGWDANVLSEWYDQCGQSASRLLARGTAVRYELEKP